MHSSTGSTRTGGAAVLLALAALALSMLTTTPARAAAGSGPATGSPARARPPLGPLDAASGAGPGAAPTRAAATTGDVTYLYASAFGYGTATRVTARLANARPVVEAADHHSLVELAAVSLDGQQIVEVGWTVDPAVNGDARPHLFVYHWVDGQPSCYNGCGFVTTSTTLRPGMLLRPADGPLQYGLAHVGDRWWVTLRGKRIGYFPDSLWQGRFTSAGEQLWFGEVAAGSGRPCTDVGNGRAPSATSGQLVSDLATDLGPVSPALSATDRSLYDIVPAANGIRLGGAGAC